MKVYAIANQKGGIGKTTTATCIAAILQQKGYKVLLIDTDQQCNSTDTYRAKIESTATLYDVLLDENKIPLSEAIQQTESGDIIAADPLLREADKKLTVDVEGLYRMQDALVELNNENKYDYVIIDTAPALNSLLHNVLIAADEVIIPLTADRYALQGLSQLNDSINAIKRRQNPKLKVAGLLLIKYTPRTLLAREVKAALHNIAKQMNTKVFRTTIRESTKAREAQAMRITLIKHAPLSTTEQDYESFVNELLQEE